MKGDVNQCEISVALTSTIASFLKDDEDYQLIHAKQLLTYLSHKGYYPPEQIISVIVDILKSPRSSDEAVTFQIMEILNVFKDNNHIIGLSDWDLFMNALASLKYHLSGIESLEYPKDKMFQFVCSKLLVTYFITSYHVYVENVDSTRHRKNRIIDEIMTLLQFCDLETFKELLGFLITIYESDKQAMYSTLPLICEGFKRIENYNRKVIFCQLLPPGKIKNVWVTAFIEDICKGKSLNDKSTKRSKQLIEELTPWFKKLLIIDFKKKKTLSRKNGGDEDFTPDVMNQSIESVRSLYSMDLDLQEPIGNHELFVLLCSQLYQSSIITATEFEEQQSNHNENIDNNEENTTTTTTTTTATTSTSTNNGNDKSLNWENIQKDYIDLFYNPIVQFIQDKSNFVSNPDLIQLVLDDLNLIFECKSNN